MKAGAGKSEIILAEEYLEIEDFAVIHRTLNARAVVIQSGQTVVLLSLEITSMPDEETYAIVRKLQKIIRLRRIMCGYALHTLFPHLIYCRILF